MQNIERPRLLIVDDHEMVIEALVRLLGRRFDIIGTLTDGLGVVDEFVRLQPDVLLLDLSDPQMSGLEILQQLNRCNSLQGDRVDDARRTPASRSESLRRGASAFVLKQLSGRSWSKRCSSSSTAGICPRRSPNPLCS